MNRKFKALGLMKSETRQRRAHLQRQKQRKKLKAVGPVGTVVQA